MLYRLRIYYLYLVQMSMLIWSCTLWRSSSVKQTGTGGGCRNTLWHSGKSETQVNCAALPKGSSAGWQRDRVTFAPITHLSESHDCVTWQGGSGGRKCVSFICSQLLTCCYDRRDLLTKKNVKNVFHRVDVFIWDVQLFTLKTMMGKLKKKSRKYYYLRSILHEKLHIFLLIE